MRFISITLLALFMLLLPHFASASPFWAANDTVVLQDTVYMKDLLNTANMDSVLEAILLQSKYGQCIGSNIAAEIGRTGKNVGTPE